MPPAAAATAVAAPVTELTVPARRRRLVTPPVEAPGLPVEVLESKLRPLALPEPVVRRVGLVNRLRVTPASLVAVIGAAGYGKTTLLAQWAEREERPVAWLTLDGHDNDVRILVRHLAAALGKVQPLDPDVAAAIAHPAPSLWTAAVPRLAAAASSIGRPFVLFLDDADALESGEPADVLQALADNLPAGSVLVLAGRSAPPLPLARLRTSGRLLELGTAELALSRREAQLLLRGLGTGLDDPQASALLAAAEGWAVGIHLAASALEAAAGSRALPERLGADRYLAEYFRAEHLSRLEPERIAFLRRTSILERACGALCDATLEAEGSAHELAELERANLFVAPLDRTGEWYRYHALFRDALRRELAEEEPELVPVLHGRAAEWHEARGDLEAALGHALEAGDAAWAARLLTAVALPVYRDGRLDDVERWVEELARLAPLRSHPAAAAIGAWAHALRGRTGEAATCLAAAESAGPRARLADGTSVRALARALRALLCAHGVGPMRRDASAAISELPSESPWLPTALLVEGAAFQLAGETGRADRRYADAAEAADASGAVEVRLVVGAQRSLLAAAAGDHSEAERLALEARDMLARSQLGDDPTAAVVRAATARASLRHGRWDEARRELDAAEKGAAALTHAIPWLTVETRLALAGAFVMLRDRNAAAAELARIDEVLAHRRHLGVRRRQLADLRAELAELPAPSEGHQAGLTAAELRLLPLLATHLSFREIGEHLFVSRNTIKTQAISTYRKLGVSSRSAAIERAAELGLVDAAARPS